MKYFFAAKCDWSCGHTNHHLFSCEDDMLFSCVKIRVFAWKLAWYFICVYIIKFILLTILIFFCHLSSLVDFPSFLIPSFQFYLLYTIDQVGCTALNRGQPGLLGLQSTLNGHLYKMDTSLKRTARVGPCLSLLPLFDSLWDGHLSKTDTYCWSQRCPS